MITNAGGLGILCADACEAAGLELPTPHARRRATALAAFLPSEASVANPIDMLGSATAASYEKALPLILADPGVDALIVLFVPPVAVTADDVGAAIAAAAAAGPPDKPVLASIIAAGGTPATLGGVPSFAYPESAASALGRACQRADWLRTLDRDRAGAARDRPRRRGGDRRRALDGATDALARRPPTRGRCSRPTGSRSSASAWSTAPTTQSPRPPSSAIPVVVKTAAAGAHKTEQGGVALDLEDEAAVREAVERIGLPGARAADGEGLRGAARRRRPGSGLRAARRVRPGRRLRRADRRRRASGSRRSPTSTPRSSSPRGKAGTLVAGFRGAPGVGQPRARRPRAAARPARRGPARGGRARPQPGARARAGLRRRRRAHPREPRGRRSAAASRRGEPEASPRRSIRPSAACRRQESGPHPRRRALRERVLGERGGSRGSRASASSCSASRTACSCRSASSPASPAPSRRLDRGDRRRPRRGGGGRARDGHGRLPGEPGREPALRERDRRTSRPSWPTIPAIEVEELVLLLREDGLSEPTTRASRASGSRRRRTRCIKTKVEKELGLPYGDDRDGRAATRSSSASPTRSPP